MEIQKEFYQFMEELSDRFIRVGFNFLTENVDHVCYRASDMNDYAKFRKEFKDISKLVIDYSYIGRKFTCFLLKTQLKYKNLEVSVIEFSEPSDSRDYKSGFQHVELLSKSKLEDFVSPGVFTDGEVSDFGVIFDDNLELEITQTPLLVKSCLMEDVNILVN